MSYIKYLLLCLRNSGVNSVVNIIGPKTFTSNCFLIICGVCHSNSAIIISAALLIKACNSKIYLIIK